MIFKNNDMCEKYLLFGQSFMPCHCLLYLTPLAASPYNYYFSMQAQQGSHEEQGDGDYTRTFSSATLLWHLMAMQLEVPGSTSLYNDRKGIKVTVSFQPLLPPLKPGKKRCMNAKPVWWIQALSITKTLYGPGYGVDMGSYCLFISDELI